VVEKKKMGRPVVSAGHPSAESKDMQKAVLKPTTGDLQRMAGFLEGEGCFSWTAKNYGPRGCMRVHAVQKELEPLYELQLFFGGSVGLNRGIFTWSVCGARARGVAMTLYPLLSTRRREKIKELLGH